MTTVQEPSAWADSYATCTEWRVEGVQGELVLGTRGSWVLFNHDGEVAQHGKLQPERREEYLRDPEGLPASEWARDLLLSL